MVFRFVFVMAAMTTLTMSAQGQAKTSKATAGPSAPAARTPAAGRVRYVVAPTGNEARYRVREQLVGFDLPNDAVGVTKEIAGSILVEPNGAVVRDSSKITVTVSNLKSDKDRRDQYIKRKTMETEKFPIVELIPTMMHGLGSKPDAATPSVFEMLGDLTVHGVTRPTTWKVSAKSDGADVVGTATTAFTFKDFGLDQPKVPVLLSVEDTIKLEYDFRFSPAKP